MCSESEHQLIHTDSEDFIAVNIYEGMANDKVQKKKSIKGNIEDGKIEAKSSGEFTLLRKSVLPHIIKFPEKSSRVNII